MPEHRTTDSEFSSLPTPATSEPGFTVSPVDKDGQPTNNPNERWYHPETGRLLQKGISQVLRENDLLRTPAASEAERGHQPEDKSRARGGQVTLSGQMMTYFPTPNTMDHLPARTPEQKEKNKGKGGYANVRETVVNDLLPTTRAQHGEDRNNKIYARDPKQPQNLENSLAMLPTPMTSDASHNNNQASWNRKSPQIGAVVHSTNWSKFEPAIRRWEETLGRPAPAPTKQDGKEGNHRLSSAFTEWMMGVPEGWITDCGLSRNEELKACGNGVVPQQAELALRVLLQGITLPAGGGK
jgi:DNA (cytosine-5)-methyltransferase 1